MVRVGSVGGQRNSVTAGAPAGWPPQPAAWARTGPTRASSQRRCCQEQRPRSLPNGGGNLPSPGGRPECPAHPRGGTAPEGHVSCTAVAMATRHSRLARTRRGIDPSRAQNASRASLGPLPADRRGGALVEYLMLGVVAILGMHALPKLDASTSKKLTVQAECGLLNADCGAGSSSGSAQATPAGATPGEQGKPARQAPSR